MWDPRGGPLTATVSSPPRPDLSAWEARPPARAHNALFSRSDGRSRHSRSLLFCGVRGWRVAPQSGIWAEAGRNLPGTKKGVGVSFGGGSLLSLPARRVTSHPGRERCILMMEAAARRRLVEPSAPGAASWTSSK